MCVVIGEDKSLCRKKKNCVTPKLREKFCDESCISTNIQDGGQLRISSKNILLNKADIKTV